MKSHLYVDPPTEESMVALDRVFPDRQSSCRKIMQVLLECRERTGKPRPFWHNTNPNGVSVCVQTIARLAEMSEQEAGASITALIKDGELVGSNPHFGIVDIAKYYNHPRRTPSGRRVAIPVPVRNLVLATGRCLRCGRTERLSVDHIIPVAKGGSDELKNLQCLCLYCNCSKRDRFVG
jgi:5-methylcytosine-specific restriction endonuclease McrA